ncbi:MAG: hypothetical protein JNM11_09225 [Chitinimonas sp.]|nr:hypothetical protein [Chitinimonas sp.]
MQSTARTRAPNRYLIAAGIAALAGSLLHLAIPVGGPSWYAFFGAPDGLVAMARAGHWYPVICCLVIALALLLAAAYAFSGAGMLRRLPWQRTVLLGISAVLVLRGIGFIPLMLWQPERLADICNCQGVDTFLVITSLLCLSIGMAYALGTRQLWRQPAC